MYSSCSPQSPYWAIRDSTERGLFSAGFFTVARRDAATNSIWSIGISIQQLYVGCPLELIASNRIVFSVPSIALELRGSSGVLRGLGDGTVRPAVILEMSNVLPGERTFTIGDGSVKLSRGVRL